MKNKWLKSVPLVVLVSMIVGLVGCKQSSYINAYQVSDDISAYGADDTVFENIAVPYQECNADYTVFVSPNGDNKNDGSTIEKAVSSVKQAQVLVREYLDGGNKGDCQILIDDGEYFLSGPIELTKQDVANGNCLYIRAINPNQATLTGSKQVVSDSIVEVQDEKLGRVWKIPCTEDINQLYMQLT